MSWYEVLPVSQLKANEMKVVEVLGKRISVTKVGSNFFAFDDTCTHHQCSLSEGFIDGTTVECPCHGGKFDVRTGEVLVMPPTVPLSVYPVKTENGAVFVDI